MRLLNALSLLFILSVPVNAATVAIEISGTIKLDSTGRYYVPPEIKDGAEFKQRITLDDHGAVTKAEFFSGDAYVSSVAVKGGGSEVSVSNPTPTLPGDIILVFGHGDSWAHTHKNVSLPEASPIGFTPDNLPPSAYIEDFQHIWPDIGDVSYAGPRADPTNTWELAALFSEYWNQKLRKATFFMLFAEYYFENLTTDPKPYGPEDGYWLTHTRVTSFTLENTSARATVVPLPASLPLLFAGLGVLGVMRVRRSRKSKADS